MIVVYELLWNLKLPRQMIKQKGETLDETGRHLLVCPTCGAWLRPHVLWFDETYNERYFRFNSAIDTTKHTDLLITVGSTGATTLPNHIAKIVFDNGGLMIDINVADNPFASLAMESNQGVFIKHPSGETIAKIVDAIASV